MFFKSRAATSETKPNIIKTGTSTLRNRKNFFKTVSSDTLHTLADNGSVICHSYASAPRTVTQPSNDNMLVRIEMIVADTRPNGADGETERNLLGTTDITTVNTNAALHTKHM